MNPLLSRTAKYLIIILIIIPVSAFAAEGMASDVKTLHVFGTGTLTGDNAPQAVKDAIRNSLISGSESVIAELLPPETIVNNFHLINKLLSSHAESRFIEKYTVLAEERSSRSYRVMVKATIDVAGIKRQLEAAGISVPGSNMPEVLLMISEKVGGSQLACWWQEDSPSRSVSEKEIANLLQNRGFSVLNEFAENQSTPSADLGEPLAGGMDADIESLPGACDPSGEKIDNLARKYGAVITLAGKVSVSEALNTIGEDKSFKAVISINAVNNLGITLATSTAEKIVADADPSRGCRRAMVSAAETAGNDIIAKISELLKKTEKKNGSSDVIELHLGGYNFYPSFMVFRKELVLVPGVKNVQTLEMMPDKAILSLRFADDGAMLARELVVKSFGKFGIQINHASENRLDINFVPPGRTE